VNVGVKVGVKVGVQAGIEKGNRRGPATVLLSAMLLAACVSTPPRPPEPPPVVEPVKPPPPVVKRAPPKIALALGGGAAKGFAHIGVIKALEAQDIHPSIVVGTSAGSVVGSMYAAGKNGFELQELAMQLDKSSLSDWTIFGKGALKGEALQDFINKAVGQRPIEKLGKTFAAVATDAGSGEPILFQVGNTGMAVRASSSVPGVFQPVPISGREYVDGGLVAPIPVRFAKSLGADLVIAVDISEKPQQGKTDSTFALLMQTFNIMGNALGKQELEKADFVIRPKIVDLSSTNFETRHQAVLEGEKAAAKVMPDIRARLASWAEGK
jgi:NTE family protein